MNRYHWARKSSQLFTLLLICLIPAVGLFRIDLASASFFILGRQVEWSNYPFLIGLSLLIATAPIITYKTVGSVWCGWACPHNLFSEWANNLTKQLLGKRADVSVDGEGMIVAASKNKLINWILLGASLLAASMVLAYVALMFFYTPSDMWQFLVKSSERQPSMLIMYLFAVFLFFIDIGVIRYFFCDYACLYRVGDRMFRTKDALHVTYDASRSSDCEKCNYCATNCITGIQPTDIKRHDVCIDCGECIDACNRLHAKSGTVGLLKFAVGTDGALWRRKIGKLFTRFNILIGVFFLAGMGLMVWGVATQKIVNEKQLMLDQQKIQSIAHVCNMQCMTEQKACSGKNITACYRAAACKCACSVKQDPSNALAPSWKQCASENTARANASSR